MDWQKEEFKIINQVSLEAFKKVQPKINNRQEQILRHLGWVGESTDAMTSNSLKLPINCITPRRGELVKMGLVERNRIGECLATGGTATYWKVTEKGKLKNEQTKS